MMRPTPFALLLVLLVGFAAAGLSACGTTAKLLPAGSATRLDDQLQAAGDALSAGNCAQAQQALTDAQATFASLPSSVDQRLSARLRDGLDHVAATLPTQCAAGTTTAAPTGVTTGTTGPADTTTTTETTTTDTTTDTTTTQPTDTLPTVPTTPTSPTPTTTTPPPPTGGVSPDAGTGAGTTSTGKTP